jgi:excinuclease ABC subunit A
MEFFDPGRVVAFPSLSLSSGAVKGWDRRNGYYFSMLESVAKHYGADVDKPFESLDDKVQHAMLNGSGEEEIKFNYTMESGASAGKKITKKHPFEGILPNMERRYRETDSVIVREDLARYRSVQPCTECAGTRLRREARSVKLGEGPQAKRLFEISASTLRMPCVFQHLGAERRQRRDCGQSDQRDCRAFEVFKRRGVELFKPEPQRGNAERW